MPGCRLSLDGKCSSCGIYNPVMNGCGLMCSALPMGEEVASCRQELDGISKQLEMLTNAVTLGLSHTNDVLETISLTIDMEGFAAAILAEQSIKDDQQEGEH